MVCFRDMKSFVLKPLQILKLRVMLKLLKNKKLRHTVMLQRETRKTWILKREIVRGGKPCTLLSCQEGSIAMYAKLPTFV
jgi:hypothetical protein